MASDLIKKYGLEGTPLAKGSDKLLSESVLDKLNHEIASKGLTLGTRKATDWMIRKLRGMTVSRANLMRDEERLEPQTFLGGMFFYYYDAKHKKTLPYWDKFPLVIPTDLYDDGWAGLNLHYLGPRERVILLDKLSQYVNNAKFNETTRFQLSYQLLASASKLDMFKPCYKRYLASHARSEFLRIDAYEWHIACLLPVALFQKESQEYVWKQSRGKY